MIKLAINPEEVQILNIPYSKYIDLRNSFYYQLIVHNTDSEYETWFEDKFGTVDWYLS